MEDDGPPWTKRERKRAGTMFFLWMTFDCPKDGAVFGVTETLGLEIVGSGGSAGASLVELEKKPSEDHLQRLAAIHGVTKVWLAP